MHSLKYLNGVLTVLAVLLTLNLWVSITDSSVSDHVSITQQAHAQGAANAAQQRQEMVSSLKQVNTQLGEVKALLKSGDLRVRVDAPRGEGAGQ